MTTIAPCSSTSVSLIPGAAFTIKKNNYLTRCSLPKKSRKHTLSSQIFILPLPNPIGFFPKCRTKYTRRPISASGAETNVVVEQSEPTVSEEKSISPEIPADEPEKSTTPPAQSKRSRPTRKSEMPPVKNEELIPGAKFTGKVRSIQPFGAFVDFGAFTDGLVHVSQLSDSFVKDVNSVVSIGQEVTVKLVEVNTETSRISLTMRENDSSPSKPQKQERDKRNTQKPGGQRRQEAKASKFVKGQELQGTIKNLTRSGCFISLPEGEEGFLPHAEEADEGLGSMMGGSSLEVGQEVTVRVLRFARGQVTLTMKKEEENSGSDLEVSQTVVHAATNPFMLAFRKNKEISAFLDEREKVAKESVEPEQVSSVEPVEEDEKPESTESESSEIEGAVQTVEEEAAKSSKVSEEDEKPESTESESLEIEGAVQTVEEAAKSSEVSEEDKTESTETESSEIEGAVQTPEEEAAKSSEVSEEDEKPEVVDQPLSSDSVSADISSKVAEAVEEEDKPESTETESSEIEGAVQIAEDETAKSSEISEEDEKPEVVEQPLTSDAVISSTVAEAVEEEDKPESSETKSSEIEGAVQTVEGEAAKNSEVAEEDKKPEVEDQPLTSDVVSADVSSIVAEEVVKSSEPEEAPLAEETESDEKLDASEEISNQISAPVSPIDEGEESKLVDATPEENESKETTTADENGSITGSGEQADVLPPLETEVEKEVESAVNEVQTEASVTEAETPSTLQIENEKDDPVPEKSASSSDSSGQSNGASPAATISPALVKQLREETGAGMMDCKKALSESGGDIVKAQEFLRKKGLASAEKKSSRTTAEGRIGSYIHDSRIGILIEVNCETDFVSRGEIFKELVDDLAMQVAACPQVQYLSTDDVPEELVAKEKEIEMQKEDLLSKPEQIRAKIVEGRIMKRLGELALLEQPYIKNDKVVIKDWVKQTIATIGENIKVKRFVRYNLGEGLEKKSQDFAAEVAAQTSAKPVATPAKEESTAAPKAEETSQKPAAAISAALVKQLREETGAGMMDCKKALSETNGDLEKAQEYLRKKGLSAADKKSSRLAAEGRIGSYIHDSRIGVLIEVNCETDFVGRSEKFKELVDDLAMQVVASPQVQYVSVEDIPKNIVDRERELEMQREDLLNKPENIREKIVDGRISKRLGELALLEQPFIKNDSILVKDLVKQTVAGLGENIKVRRFIRFTLGESTGDEKPDTEAGETGEN